MSNPGRLRLHSCVISSISSPDIPAHLVVHRLINMLFFLFFYCTIFAGQGCSRNPCGVNAQCQETLGGRPVCSCPAGHSGNPLSYCRRSECLDHTECAGHLSCRNGNCVDPCAGTCGSNANCEVRFYS